LIGSIQTTCGFIVAPIDSKITLPGRAFSVCLSPHAEMTLNFSVASSYDWTGLVGAPPGCTPKIVYTTKSRMRLIDLSKASSTYYLYGAYSAVGLYCGNLLRQLPPPDDWNPAYYTWGVVPDANPNPLWPFPNILYYLVPVTPPNTTYLDEAPYDPKPNRFSYAVLESYESFTDTRQLFSLSEREWNTCQLQFQAGFVTNIDGTPVEAGPTMNIKKERVECESETFGAVKSKMDSLIRTFDRTKDGLDLATITVTIDNLSFSKYYLACWDLATSFLEKVGNQSVLGLNSTLCVADADQRATDPCCNTLVGWDGPCCLPRTVEALESVYQISKESVMEQCNEPTCSRSYSVDFIEEHAKLTTKISGCANPFVRPSPTPDSLRYSHCRDLFFGANQTVGIACDDNECGKFLT
jgi:hypothetical protein